MWSPLPNRGEQRERDEGDSSTVSRGTRQKDGREDALPCIRDPHGHDTACRKSGARLRERRDEGDPLVCPTCQGTMRIISSIEDPSVIRVLLTPLGLWLARARPSPHAHSPPIREYADVNLQIHTHADTIYGDPEYTWDEYIQS